MIEKFGTLQDGRTVHRITINKGPLKARILTYGATLQDFRLDGHDNSLTLGFATLGDYVTHGGYFGATVGRCANRIGHAKFDLDGRSYELDANFLDKHQLHGGRDGTATRVWSIDKAEPDYVTLTHELPDGHMGYPGNLKISATFGVDKSGLDIRYKATTDAPTICNLAHHSYWVLDDSGSILDHELIIGSQDFVPVDDELIPVGGTRAVDGTHLDFLDGRPIREGAKNGIIDHNFCFAPMRSTEITPHALARLASWKSNLALSVRSTEPGLQVYDSGLMDLPILDIDGRALKAHSGLALEPQNWPDAINQKGFPDVVLRPGETYNQHTRFEIERMN